MYYLPHIIMFEGDNSRIFNVLRVAGCVHWTMLYCFCIKLIK